MGVAMAWPTARYKAEDVVLARLSDTRLWPQSRSFGSPPGRRHLSRKEAGLSPLSRGGNSGGSGAIGGIAELTVLPLWRLLSSPFRMLFSAGTPAIGAEKSGGSGSGSGGDGGGLVPKREERQVDAMDEAKKKFNMVIVAKLRPSSSADDEAAAAAAAGAAGEGAAGSGVVSSPPSAPVFNVATYHMPCMFWAPQVRCHAHQHRRN